MRLPGFAPRGIARMPAPPPLPRLARGRGRGGGIMRVQTQRLQFLAHAGLAHALGCEPGGDTRAAPARMDRADRHLAGLAQRLDHRSEEHTSELPSLMRISYAAFCLHNNKSTYKRRTNEHKT